MCDYVCHLDPLTIKRAHEELNEDPKERNGQLQALKDWIKEQKWLSIPTDNFFMLGVLRDVKFCQLKARQIIIDIATLPSIKLNWALGRNPVSENICRCLELGTMVILPEKDKEGHTILIFRPGVMDTIDEQFTTEEIGRAVDTILGFINMDECCQINGIVVVFDFSYLTMKTLSRIGFEAMKKSITDVKRLNNHRLRRVHFYNNGPVFDTIYSVIGHMISAKVKSRTISHGHDLQGLYKYIDMSMLPDEYLPDDYMGPRTGTIQQILKNIIADLSQPDVLSWFERFHTMTWINEELKPKQDQQQEYFRKLNTS